MIKILKVLFLLSIFSVSNIQSQFKGKVVDVFGKSLAMINISVRASTKGTATDSKGYFSLDLSDGEYFIELSATGYEKLVKEVSIKGGSYPFQQIVLKEAENYLNEVVVKSKTKAEVVQEKSFAVASVDTKNLKSTTMNADDVLSKVSGVNIRKSGGLGANYTFSMNGLSGKQVKFFIDGIPLDNLGSSIGLNNFPVNLIDRIDVYKGVVPVYLGADALGGAVNLVTSRKKTNYLDVSYGAGSFNTHIFSFLGRYQSNKSGLVAKIASFSNYSDNNYTIDNVAVTDKFGNINGKKDDVERTHDAYNSSMCNLQLGVSNKGIADELLLGGLFSFNNKELQHSYDFQKPFGEIETEEGLRQFSLTYKKKNLIPNLNIKLYTSLSKNSIKFRDTSSYRYYWYKERKLRDDQKGEFGSKTLTTINDKMHLINTSVTYDLVPKKHQLILNYSKSFLERVGSDKISKSFVAFEKPHSVDKNIVGLSYDTKLVQKKLNTSLFVKHNTLQIKGRDRNPFSELTENVNETFSKYGYGFATSYKVKTNLQIKTSFEKALRLPDGYEVFGDGAFTESNVRLLPEKSYNLNFGGIYTVKFKDDYKLYLDVNGYHRKASNLIVILPKIITRVYQNSYDAKIQGVEGALNLSYKDLWSLKTNITKQNIEENLKGKMTKIPNIPLFFGNVDLVYTLKNSFNTDDRFSFMYGTRYVDTFPVASYTSGNSDRPSIDSQISQSFSANYSLKKYHISFSVKNIWDSSLYDNFRLQQPGRAFYLKFRYAM